MWEIVLIERHFLDYRWEKTAVLGIIHTIMDKEASPQASVLIIDDERPVREAISDILEIEGIAVIAADNGEMGVQLYRQNQAQIQLIILDLSMPNMSGEETLAQLQAINPNVNVILSSGYSESNVTALIAQKDHVKFLAKPYKIDHLLAKIAEFLT